MKKVLSTIAIAGVATLALASCTKKKEKLTIWVSDSDGVKELTQQQVKSFKKAYPATPWKTVQGMRHVLVHDYAHIVSETLYDTAVNGIPELREQVAKYLADIDWEAWESAPDDYEDSVDEEMAKLARRMKSDGLTPELITKYTGLTPEEIERL